MKKLLFILVWTVFVSACQTMQTVVNKAADIGKETVANVKNIPLLKNKESNTVAKDDDTENVVKEALVIVDKHSYESPLTVNDRLCTEIVSPFKLEKNIDRIISEAAKKGAESVATNVVLGKKEDSEEVALNAAKAEAKKSNWLTMKYEKKIGWEYHKKRLEEGLSVIDRKRKGKRTKRLYDKADKLLARVVASIEEEHPYEFEVILINNSDVNATALPGGYIYVNTGVLKSPSAELVIGHEVAHVLKRHETYETQAHMIDLVDSVDHLKKLVTADEKQYEKIIARLVNYFGSVDNFSKQQELQSDACAVRIAGKIPDTNIAVMIDSFIKSIEDTKGAKKDRDGHPNYPERRKTMEEVSKKMLAVASR